MNTRLCALALLLPACWPACWRDGPGPLGVFAPTAAAAQQPVVVLDRALRPTPAFLLAIDRGKVTFGAPGPDGGRAKRTVALEDVAAIIDSAWWLAEEGRVAGATPSDREQQGDASPGVVELTDGQRLVGQVASAPTPAPGGAASGAAPAKDAPLYWAHRTLGVVGFPLDRVSRVKPEGFNFLVSAPGRAEADRVRLTNGDAIFGLVERIGQEVVLVPSRQGGGQGNAEPSPPITLPIDKVVEVLLVNPPVAPAPGAAMLWLADGTILAAPGAALASVAPDQPGPSDARTTITLPERGGGQPRDGASPGASTSRLTLGTLRALVPAAGAVRPIAALPVVRQEAGSGRAFLTPITVRDGHAQSGPLARALADAPLNAHDVLVPGPMVVEWALPPGVRAASATLELPRDCREWGDCTVTVSAVPGGTTGSAPGTPQSPLAEVRLNGQSPAADVRVDIPAGAARLRVEVGPGRYGPVQDRVLVRRGVVGG